MPRNLCFVDFCEFVNNTDGTTKKTQTHRLGKTPNPNAHFSTNYTLQLKFFEFTFYPLNYDHGYISYTLTN